MANRKKVKITIDRAALSRLISARDGLKIFSSEIGYSEITIRRGIEDGEMSPELVFRIGSYFGIPIKQFADFEGYYSKLKEWSQET